jgi:hypothetical protein
MSLKVKSIDEELINLADIYDSLIAPKKIWRNNNNKLYLLLRAIAAGNVSLNDTAIALHNRFNPALCDDIDLYSLTKITGTDFLKGKGSLLDINVTNDGTETKVLPAGVYTYQVPNGAVFSLNIVNSITLDPLESGRVTAISVEKGVYPVGDISSIKLSREDGEDIDGAFNFSCEDNSNQLGYEDETSAEFRARILADTEKGDILAKLESDIKNLPIILECNLIFNDSVYARDYDGITLAAKELLIVLTGVPTNEIARLVSEAVIYDTHQADPDKVVWYENGLYVNGRRPVYYTNHQYSDFSIKVNYQYSSRHIKPIQIETAITGLFKSYKAPRKHIDIFAEKDAYSVISGLNLPSLIILNIDIVNSDGEVSPFVRIPKTRLPRLTGIEFLSDDIER